MGIQADLMFIKMICDRSLMMTLLAVLMLSDQGA